MGSANVDLQIRDESYDSQGETGVSHLISISAKVVSGDSSGWGVSLTPTSISNTAPGTTYHATLIISAGSLVRNPTAKINITVKLEGWATAYAYAQVFAKVNGTPIFTVSPVDPPITVKPYDIAIYRLSIVNSNIYPQTYKLWTKAESGWSAQVTSTLALDPLSSDEVYVAIVAPADRFYYRGESEIIEVYVQPEGNESYIQMVPLVATVRGFYLSPWFYYVWLPILIACGLAGAYGITRKVEKEHKEQVDACGPKPEKRGFSYEEKARLAKVKEEKPNVYALLVQKRERDYDIQLKKYKMCVRIYKQKRELLAQKRREIAKAKSANSAATKNELAKKKKEKKALAGEKRKAEKKLNAAKRKLEKKARKIKNKEIKRQAKIQRKQDKTAKKENAKQKKIQEKQIAIKKKEIEKLTAVKKKETEKKKKEMMREIEKKKREAEKQKKQISKRAEGEKK
jgi:hypothetical protein